jgi:hypothetical protein
MGRMSNCCSHGDGFYEEKARWPLILIVEECEESYFSRVLSLKELLGRRFAGQDLGLCCPIHLLTVLIFGLSFFWPFEKEVS